MALLDLSGNGDVIAQARSLYQAVPEALVAIDDLEAIARQVRRQAPAAELHFDLAELGGYHYYTGAMFSAFVPGQGRAVAKGGRYDGIGRAFGRDRAATGFSAYLGRLLKVGDAQTNGVTGVLAPADADADLVAEVARLRAAGERVVCQLPGDGGNAADFDCDRVLIKRSGRWQVAPYKR
jgi:ATP phosphoribosyltransferase regulatory subunit